VPAALVAAAGVRPPCFAPLSCFFLQHDSDAYIGLDKTIDPQLTQWLAANQQQPDAPQDQLPPYTGMQHPPPSNTGNARCDSMPWSAPFGPNYTVHSSSTGSNSSLQLTMCNWYLPQGPGVTAVHRCDIWFPRPSRCSALQHCWQRGATVAD
jgi:hypothetical protein